MEAIEWKLVQKRNYRKVSTTCWTRNWFSVPGKETLLF